MSQPTWSKRIPKKLVIFVVVCVAIYAAWNIAYPSGSWRYKLTVEVETPEGLKTGSAVREVHAYYFPQLTPEMGKFHASLKNGEAVVIDLGSLGVVFALNRTYKRGVDGGFAILQEAYPVSPRKSAPKKTPPKVLQQEQYPIFVRFVDPADPKTVENLLDMQTCEGARGSEGKLCVKNDRFAEAFGEGVKLKSVTIAISDEPVTTGVVERYLPWILTIGKGNLGGGKFSGSLFYERLGAWDFRREPK